MLRGMAEPPIFASTLIDVQERTVVLPSVRVAVTSERGSPIEAALGFAPIVVGTSPECDLVVSDARVSRRHCELRLTPRGIVLRDLGSKNGTFLGEVPIVEIILPVDVTVTMGASHLSARVSGAPSTLSLSSRERFGDAVGRSVAMRALFAKLERAAATSETILLLGESGTGKEVLARAIHDASPRAGGPFVVLDCSAIAPSLVEAEVFGYARGAFTGAATARAGLLEQSEGGTLFIDEIGELPLDLQPKLLRALEARKVRRLGSNEWVSFDARVVAATHRNLRAQVASGAFRQDLYYRLAVVEVSVPSLRERKDDIPLLVEHFLARREPRRALADLPPHAMDILRAYDWPGNVRELRNIVARLVLFPELGLEGLAPVGAQPASAGAPAPVGASVDDEGLGELLALPLLEARETVVAQLERRYLTVKLREHDGNVTRTADAVGVSRQFLHRLIERHNLRSERQ
jgi:DNA-binding NtrC family response regulator